MARRRSNSWGWGYFHHTTTREIEQSAKKAMDSARKKGLEFRPVKILGTKITRTWWGNSWCQNLERYADYVNRLPRGRTYVRHDAVVDLRLEKGEAHAKVQGSSLYQVDIRFDPLDPKLEKELGEACSRQIQNVEDLIAGKFPEPLKERFLARGGLFPSPKEIHFKCSCPDWASMCKHVAAVMYGIGARLDEEPLGFFDLRGIQTDDFVSHAVRNKVEQMLSNATRTSSRIMADDQLADLFGMEIGVPPEKSPKKTRSKKEAPLPAEAQPIEAALPKRRGRPPRNATSVNETSPANTATHVKKTRARRRGRPPRKPASSPVVETPREIIQRADCSEKIKQNLILLSDRLQGEIFGNTTVMETLQCSAPTATNYLKRLHEDLNLIVPVQGHGKGKYRFRG